ncbi:hypothetical protein D3C81_948270 [compost metagenome]
MIEYSEMAMVAAITPELPPAHPETIHSHALVSTATMARTPEAMAKARLAGLARPRGCSRGAGAAATPGARSARKLPVYDSKSVTASRSAVAPAAKRSAAGGGASARVALAAAM